MKILITGAGGMVGRALARYCSTRYMDAVAYERGQLDIGDTNAVHAVVKDEAPDAIVNCAAWTDVDGCEQDSARAFRLNSDAVETLAKVSRRVNAAFVTISTDFVFDGKKEGFYTQDDEPRPLNVYGAAKLEGERRALAAYERTTVVRTGWVFGHGGRNFLSRVIHHPLDGSGLKAIGDAYGTPTYAEHLARRLYYLACLDMPGVYHVTSEGVASYAEFARLALDLIGNVAEVEPVTMDSLPRPALRPRNSGLRCLISNALGFSPLPDWKDALREYVHTSARAE